MHGKRRYETKRYEKSFSVTKSRAFVIVSTVAYPLMDDKLVAHQITVWPRPEIIPQLHRAKEGIVRGVRLVKTPAQSEQ